jgi:hypothetical protein
VCPKKVRRKKKTLAKGLEKAGIVRDGLLQNCDVGVI